MCPHAGAEAMIEPARICQLPNGYSLSCAATYILGSSTLCARRILNEVSLAATGATRIPAAV